MQVIEETGFPEEYKSRFNLIKPLGSGGMAEVFLVEDLYDNDRIRALKVLHPSRLDQASLQRFQQEFEVLANLNHPNLVKALELLDGNDRLAYLMEAVDGLSLLDLINDKKLELNEIEKIFSSVLAGLECLHQNQLAHRDIKLENVLISKNGEVKLADLGFLKRLNGISAEKAEDLHGTVQYLAPEYIKHNHYDFRSDLYAVALMLFECIAGKRWLTGKSGQEILKFLYDSDFIFPRLALAGFPSKYERIIEKGMSLQPWKRFKSAEAMRMAILSENGNEESSQTVSVKENLSIKVVKERLKTKEFLSAKYKRQQRIRNSILVVSLSMVFLAVVAFVVLQLSKADIIPRDNIEQLEQQAGKVWNESTLNDKSDLKISKEDQEFIEFDDSYMRN